jgi:hypothetical protein
VVHRRDLAITREAGGFEFTERDGRRVEQPRPLGVGEVRGGGGTEDHDQPRLAWVG